MKTIKRALMGLLLVSTSALAYPDRPVKVVVPFPAGSQTDLVARLVAQQLAAQLGGAFVVENKPGASGTIAASQVARANPDGYTLLMTSAAIQAMNYSLLKDLPYKPEDFMPIGQVASTGMVLMVKADSSVKTMADLVALAQAKPGKLSAGYGSPGAQIALAVFKLDAKIDALEIPYKGIPNAVTDMLGGQIDFTFVDFGNALAQVKGGAARALAVTPAQGSTLMKDVPALGASYPGYSIVSWYGLMAPAQTPKDIQQALSRALAKSIPDPALVPKMATLGVEPAFMDAPQFGTHIDHEIKTWAEMIRIANIPKQ